MVSGQKGDNDPQRGENGSVQEENKDGQGAENQSGLDGRD